MHKISAKIKFGRDRTVWFWVTRPWLLKNFPIDLQWGKCCPGHSAFIFYRIFVKLAVTRKTIKSRRHKISDELEIQPEQTINLRVICPWVPKEAHNWPFPIDSAFNFDQIFIKLADNQDRHKIILGEVRIWAKLKYSLWNYLPLSDEKWAPIDL